jgi:hypothetical protein
MAQSFRDYLMGRRITDTPEGDFVGDAKRDPLFLDATTWDEVESHLRSGSACPEAIKAARNVWRQYEARISASASSGDPLNRRLFRRDPPARNSERF